MIAPSYDVLEAKPSCTYTRELHFKPALFIEDKSYENAIPVFELNCTDLQPSYR